MLIFLSNNLIIPSDFFSNKTFKNTAKLFFKNLSIKKNFLKLFSKILAIFSLINLLIFSSQNSFAKNQSTKINSQPQKNISATNTLPQITVIASTEQPSYKNSNSSSSLRVNKPMLETPQSIAVVGQTQIRDQNIVNLEEAGRYVSGFFVKQGEGNRDQVSIRGNDSTADFFIDSARDDMQYYRDFYNIEQIEFLKGPNALAFGRGGSGGLVNRVSKTANGEKIRKIILSGGSFENRRFETDLGDKINQKLSFRFSGVYEKSKTFRDYGLLEKFGLNPTFNYILNADTDIKFGYEHFYDNRFNDRGLPSQNGSPLNISSKKFVGNPNQYDSTTLVNSAFAIINHDFNSHLKIKNHTRFTNYDKYYINAFPSSPVSASGQFKLSAYDNDQRRNNFTNQTDLVTKFSTKNIAHELLIGSEISHQASSIIRKNGFFNGNNSSIDIAINDDINNNPIDYKLATSNKSAVRILAGYLQDNLKFNDQFEFIAGVRFDNFAITNHNQVSSQKLAQNQNLISPKLAIIFKPQKNIANYLSYSTSHLPSSGDQFSELDSKTKNLSAEKLQNYELGSKFDITDKFNVSGALFILDRTNGRANDPSGSGFYVLTGKSRTKGLELSANGEIYKNLNIIAGFSHLDSRIISPTTSATKNKKLALTPQNKLSLWGKYNLNEQFAVGIGFINQSSQFASVDNAVKIKGYNRFDGAIYYKINKNLKSQINVENIFNKKYYSTAHNNNNLQPGSTRAFKANLVYDF